MKQTRRAMRLEDIHPLLFRGLVEEAGLQGFLDRDYSICGVDEEGNGTPYFVRSPIQLAMPTIGDPQLTAFKPPIFDGDGRSVVGFWLRFTRAAHLQASSPEIEWAEPERASILRDQVARSITEIGWKLAGRLHESREILLVLLIEQRRIDRQRTPKPDLSTLHVHRSIHEHRMRTATGHFYEAWDMVLKGATADEVDELLNKLDEWMYVPPALLSAQRYGLGIQLARADEQRAEIIRLLSLWSSYDAMIRAAALNFVPRPNRSNADQELSPEKEQLRSTLEKKETRFEYVKEHYVELGSTWLKRWEGLCALQKSVGLDASYSSFKSFESSYGRWYRSL